MKQLITPKILSRVLILCVMLGGLIYVTTSSQTVLAAPCCQECDATHSTCLANCNGNSACIQQCNQDNFRCIRHCIMCDSGPACGEGGSWDAWCQSWGYSTCSGGYCVY